MERDLALLGKGLRVRLLEERGCIFVFCKFACECFQSLFCMHMRGSACILIFSVRDACLLRSTLIEIINIITNPRECDPN